MTYHPERIRDRTRAVHFPRMYRVVESEYCDRPLGVAPTSSRFSRAAGGYCALYAGATVRCCFCEAIIRDSLADSHLRALPQSEIDSRAVVTIGLTEALLLVDLRKDGPTRIGAPTAVVHDRRQSAGQALSAVTYATVPEADGFVYPSRFTGDACLAAFDRAIGKLQAVGIAPLTEYADVHRALSDYDIVLTKPPE